VRAVAGERRSGGRAGQRHIDQLAVELAHGPEPDTHPVGDLGTESLDEHVAPGDQFAQQRQIPGLFEVKGDRALAAVVGVEVLGDGDAFQVAVRRTLDLEDRGAEIGQDLGAERPWRVVRQVEDSQAR
jgi:hypothetical protein